MFITSECCRLMLWIVDCKIIMYRVLTVKFILPFFPTESPCIICNNNCRQLVKPRKNDRRSQQYINRCLMRMAHCATAHHILCNNTPDVVQQCIPFHLLIINAATKENYCSIMLARLVRYYTFLCDSQSQPCRDTKIQYLQISFRLYSLQLNFTQFGRGRVR